MPRISRKCNKTPYFHVMTQGIEKSFIFDSKKDIEYYINSIYLLSKIENIKVISYCIMSNHAHLVLNVASTESLSKYMQRLNTKYALYYNDTHNRVGYVFRDRYKSEGIYSERQLYTCINYVYNNPVKAGICKSPGDYPYSNYHKISINVNLDEKQHYVFLDIDNDNLTEEIVEIYLREKNLQLSDLAQNENYLKDLIILLKNKYGISLRKISKTININREKIRRLYNA